MMMDNHHVDRVMTWLGDLRHEIYIMKSRILAKLQYPSFHVELARRFTSDRFLRNLPDSDQPEHRVQVSVSGVFRNIQGVGLATLPLAKEDAHFLEV